MRWPWVSRVRLDYQLDRVKRAHDEVRHLREQTQMYADVLRQQAEVIKMQQKTIELMVGARRIDGPVTLGPEYPAAPPKVQEEFPSEVALAIDMIAEDDEGIRSDLERYARTRLQQGSDDATVASIVSEIAAGAEIPGV